MHSEHRVKWEGRKDEVEGAAHCAVGDQVGDDTCPPMLPAMLSFLSIFPTQLSYSLLVGSNYVSFPSPFLEPEEQATMS